ncbi:MAG TPA: L-serine ammonia-lyase, iron-sulfur-dependent, subunit alpha [Methanocella sp.]
MDKELLLDVLKSEIERSVGCTDPGAVCLAVHKATCALGQKPSQVTVTVSPNIYKNGISVGVPGTGMRGLHIAAALGAVIGPGTAGLTMLDRSTEEDLTAARDLIVRGKVVVGYAESPEPLYIKAQVSAGHSKAHAIISGDYTHVVEIALDGNVIHSAAGKESAAVHETLKDHSLEQLFVAIGEMSLQELSFLLDAAAVNRQAAMAGLASPASSRLGPALSSLHSDLPAPAAAAYHAQCLTAAACEARMSGLPVPVMAIAGSGNHGIANFLGILGVAETLHSSPEKTARALAISSTVTVVIKAHSSRLSAFCGCAVAAAAGVAAGTVYLLGGSYADSVKAMQSVIGTLAGMVCDGAKESCAFKLSSSVALAVQFSYLALEGASIPAGMGILGGTIEKTFENLGRLNNPGMVTADRLMLRMIADGLP